MIVYDYHENRVKKIWRHAEYLLKGVDKNELIEIDFSGVKVLVPSWADELITQEVYCSFDTSNAKQALTFLKKRMTI